MSWLNKSAIHRILEHLVPIAAAAPSSPENHNYSAGPIASRPTRDINLFTTDLLSASQQMPSRALRTRPCSKLHQGRAAVYNAVVACHFETRGGRADHEEMTRAAICSS